MSRTARTAAVASVGALLVFAGSAHAAAPGPKTFSFTDKSGDSTPFKGDIVKVTYTTTGTKTKTTYTPKKLVITIETADAIDTSGTTMYEIDSELAGCENGFDVYFTPGVEDSAGGGCVNSTGATSFTYTGLDGPPVVGDKKLTWTVTLKADPAFKVGSTISGIDAYTGVVEPATGTVGPYFFGLVNDDAPTDASYKIG
jgi:hypothetical protein